MEENNNVMRKLKAVARDIIKSQIKYEALRKSPDWEKLPQDLRERLDKMSGGLWLKGNELEEIEKR